jgi:hypothetical protein
VRLPSREARAEADWLAIDHREALRAAPAELRPMREDVARRRAAYEARQARLVELGAEMRAEAEAADRRIAEAGAAAAAALLDGFDDRSEPPPADPNGAEVAAALAVAEVAERTLAEPLRQAEGDLARRERAVAEAAENVVVRHAAELTGEYLDRLRGLGKRRARLLGIQNLTRPQTVEPGKRRDTAEPPASSSSCSRIFGLARPGRRELSDRGSQA